MKTEYGFMNPPHLMPVDGSKVLAYANIKWDIGVYLPDALINWDSVVKVTTEWVICKRKKTTYGTWDDEIIHDVSRKVLHCEVLGWFPLPSNF